jgi:hypothetical protein
MSCGREAVLYRIGQVISPAQNRIGWLLSSIDEFIYSSLNIPLEISSEKV